MKKKLPVFLLNILLSLTFFGQAPDWQWAKSAGTIYEELGTDITTDSYGNVYATGYYFGDSIRFGNITLHTSYNWHMFVVKYDEYGNVMWAKTNTGSPLVQSSCIASDPSGNVYVAGTFRGSTVIFDNITLSNKGNTDIYLVKYNTSGTVLWAKSIEGSEADFVKDLATDQNGNIFMTGGFESPTLNFNGLAVDHDNVNAGAYPNLFVVKYDPNGNPLWASATGCTMNISFGSGITIDNKGNAYIAGVFASSCVTFDNVTLLNSGYTNQFFIVKYNSSGDALWAKKADGNIDDVVKVSADGNGSIYLTGSFSSNSIQFDNFTLTNASSLNFYTDIFIVKCDSSGNFIWAKAVGGRFWDYGSDITTDNSGNIYITGGYGDDNIAFGNMILVNSTPNGGYGTTSDIFVVKCDSSGNYIWAKSAGGVQYDWPFGIWAHANGNVYITGRFSTDIAFGSTTLINTGDTDFFIAKLNSNLNPLPVNWGSFTAEEISKEILLKWTTLQEQNAHQYHIERSADGHIFSKIGSVNAAGYGSSSTTYKFIDKFPFAGANFYRLKQIDIDGSFDYSRIIRINISIVKTLQTIIAPNPFSNATTISFSLAQLAKVSLKVFDLNGRLIKILADEQKVAGSHEIKWNANNANGQPVPSGLYLLIIEAGDFKMTRKISVIN